MPLILHKISLILRNMFRLVFIVLVAAALWLLHDLPAAAWTIPGWSPTKIVIFKDRQVLELHKNGGEIKTYRVCLGLDPIGPKKITGDKKTPEGEYFICYKSTESSFHRFLGLSYPSVSDAQSAFEKGLISAEKRDAIIGSLKNDKTPPWDTALGGWVGIHGYPTDEYKRRWITLLYPKPDNWTDGCIAMWNSEIEEVFASVTVGTPVLILP
jgi:murein L,D-transpeptidase YafK